MFLWCNKLRAHIHCCFTWSITVLVLKNRRLVTIASCKQIGQDAEMPDVQNSASLNDLNYEQISTVRSVGQFRVMCARVCVCVCERGWGVLGCAG